jgi:hypothetical protein
MKSGDSSRRADGNFAHTGILMKNKGLAMHLHKLLIVVSAAVILTACGGGTDGGQPSVTAVSAEPVKTEIVLKSGAETLVEGTITTSKWLLESAEWKFLAVSGTAPDLTKFLRNQECAVVAKNDQASVILDGLGQSIWTCNLGILGPPVSEETLYTLFLVGRDVKGQAQTLTRTLRVQP